MRSDKYWYNQFHHQRYSNNILWRNAECTKWNAFGFMQLFIFSLRSWWSNNRMLYWCGCRLPGISRPLSSRKTGSWTWNIGNRSRSSGGSQARSECEGWFLCVVSVRCLLSLAMLVPQQIDEDAHCTKKKNKKCWYTASGHNVLVATWSRSNSRIIWNQLNCTLAQGIAIPLCEKKYLIICSDAPLYHEQTSLRYQKTKDPKIIYGKVGAYPLIIISLSHDRHVINE